MDIKAVANSSVGSLVEVVMVNGSTRRGTVQVAPPNTTTEILALLDERKSGQVASGQTSVSLDDYLKGFSSKTRSTFQRKLRKITEMAGGTLECRVFQTPDDVASGCSGGL